jgi:hypothetical protein
LLLTLPPEELSRLALLVLASRAVVGKASISFSLTSNLSADSLTHEIYSVDALRIAAKTECLKAISVRPGQKALEWLI